MSNKIEDLKQIIADEGMELTKRGTAAELYIAELVDTVALPGDDDLEVIERMKPWNDRALADLVSPSGAGTNGESLADARKTVFRRRKLRALLYVVVDKEAHRLERLAACKVVLDEHLHNRNRFVMNNFNESRMLDAVLPANAMKWTASGKVPVCRPPQTLADVW